MWRLALVTCALGGCADLFSLGEVSGTARDGAIDTPPDARLRFGAPVRVPVDVPSNSYANDLTLVGNEQELLYATYTFPPAMLNGAWSTVGPTSPTMWPASSDLGIAGARTLKLSPDGLFLALAIDNDLHAFRRAGRGDPWVKSDAELNGIPTASLVDQERPGTITADGLHMCVYRRDASGAYMLYLYSRPSQNEAWADRSTLLAVVRATHPAPSYSSLSPHLTADGLTLVYSMNPHAPTLLPADLWIATRDDVDEPFGTPSRIDEVTDEELNEGDPWLSPDRTRLWFTRSYDNTANRSGEWGIYVSEVEPF